MEKQNLKQKFENEFLENKLLESREARPTILGKKTAMLCTASVEEVIDEHYQNQIDQIESDEKELKQKIIKFREDELHHKDIAYEKGASKDGIYSLFDKIVKTGSKIAIRISEKI